MIVYRLSVKIYANDLSGYGAEKNGGRWNKKGISILYTASSRALAVVEIAVHVPIGIIPAHYYLTTIKIPDEAEIMKVKTAGLPPNWNKNPFIKDTQQTGNDFVSANSHLVLQVPSATVYGYHNYLINPQHPDFKKVHILSTEPFEFDSRLFKKS